VRRRAISAIHRLTITRAIKAITPCTERLGFRLGRAGACRVREAVGNGMSAAACFSFLAARFCLKDVREDFWVSF